jgi:hypothetical protein
MYSSYNYPAVRHTTPPYVPNYHPGGIGYSNPPSLGSSVETSPESNATNTSREPSPRPSRATGPVLLPKIRCQDQATEPAAMQKPMAQSLGHARAASLVIPSIYTAFPYHPGDKALDSADLHSPASASSLPASVFSPISAVPAAARSSQCTPSPLNTHFGTAVGSFMVGGPVEGSRRSSLAHVRSLSGSMPGSAHSRSVSTSSMDESHLKPCYPTQYRAMPQYKTATPPPVEPLQNVVDFQASAEYSVQAVPQYPTTTSLMNYLTAPGCRPGLIAHPVSHAHKTYDFGWWDVRTLRSWSDFSVNKILEMPQFQDMLYVPHDANSLPYPPAGHATPDNDYALRDMHAAHFAARVNAALARTQGPNHLVMRAARSDGAGNHPRPDFISTHAHDAGVFTTLRGELRGRVVGIVRPYDEWNTAMRTEDGARRVKYLRGLAQLHRVMREHGCRYGFVITEIELLCVRAGADDAAYAAQPRPCWRADREREVGSAAAAVFDEGPRPVFGMLETAAPVSLGAAAAAPSPDGGSEGACSPSSCSSAYGGGAPRMTAALALWWLHTLAWDMPPPGCAPWRMAVGPPQAASRQHFAERDPWMPKVGLQESRVAKRVRGWVWPEEAFSRKELPASQLKRQR